MALTDEISSPAPDAPRARWPSFILLSTLVLSLFGAAWQMAHRGAPSGPRDLTVLAPLGTELTVDNQESRIPIARGVHAFTVTPGPHEIILTAGSGVAQAHTLNVPAGIGPLMIEVEPGPDGALQVGVY